MPREMLGLSPYLNLWQIIVGDFFLEVADIHRLLVVIFFVQVMHTEVIKAATAKT